MSYHYEENDEIEPFQDVLILTSSELQQAQWEVDQDRKDLSRSVRRKGGTWSDTDMKMMDSMDRWAKMVLDELLRRGEEQRKKLNSNSAEISSVHLQDKESLSSTRNLNTR